MSEAKRPFRILVSNDDGYQAPGLLALADALETIGEVWVCAPERERSATSRSISLHKPLRVREWADRRFWISGTPVDSVYVGLNKIVPKPVDLVVSGINLGPNLGQDTSYSGTVGAAIEGVMMDVQAMAISLEDRRGTGFAPAAETARRLALEILERGLPPKVLLNVNIPSTHDPDDGVVVTRLGRRDYGRIVDTRDDPRGRPYFWIGGAHVSHDDIDGSDCNLVADGRATVTPLTVEMTDFSMMDALRSWNTTSE